MSLGISLGTLGLAGRTVAAAEPASAPVEDPAAEVASEPAPASWRFKDDSRPVKVFVLAGSIGAWPRDPYAKQFEALCAAVEVKNLSKTGFGALQLKQRFRREVLDNRRIPLGRGDDPHEYWLVFQGGLNSVATPESTNHHIRELYVMAHSRGIKVIGLTLTPWGDESDRRRWAGIAGLVYRDHTQKLVDFPLGRLEPVEALGSYVSRRKVAADAPWDPSELPEIAVNLYEAPYLRDAEAPLREVTGLRRQLGRDRGWQRRLVGLDEAARDALLDAEAQRAAELPRWFLREELRSFDHIHPNAEGHRRIAALACPNLPPSWSCTCPPLPPGAAAAPQRTAVEQVLRPLDRLYLPAIPRWVRGLLEAVGGDGGAAAVEGSVR